MKRKGFYVSKTSRVVRIASAVGLALALGLLAACASGAGSPSSGSSTSSDAASQPPTLTLVEPAAGGAVPAGTVTVAVESTGLEFVMPGGTNVAGEGHVHFTLDDGPIVMSVEQRTTFKDVPPGEHKLVAELVQNDTTPFSPVVKQEITFVAK